MLAFNVKTTAPVPVAKLLSPFVDPEKWKDGGSFVQELDAWREKVRHLRYSTQGAEACRDGALHYYKLVTHAAHHFRGVNLAKETKLSFRWHDTFSSKLSVTQPDWRYERAAVLFNVAASLSYLATLQDRGEPEACARLSVPARGSTQCADTPPLPRCNPRSGRPTPEGPNVNSTLLPPQGMKLACKYFQEAAGAIAEVRAVSKQVR